MSEDKIILNLKIKGNDILFPNGCVFNLKRPSERQVSRIEVEKMVVLLDCSIGIMIKKVIRCMKPLKKIIM